MTFSCVATSRLSQARNFSRNVSIAKRLKPFARRQRSWGPFPHCGNRPYRTKGASKAVPGFDVIDYGQEDYVFGDSDTDARHWSEWVLQALQENQEALAPLFEE